MVSEQFLLIEPEDGLNMLLCILSVCVYVLVGYLTDISSIHVREHAFETLKH